MIKQLSRRLLILAGVLTVGPDVPALCLDRLRIKCQRALEHFDRLRAILTRRRLCVCGASLEHVIQLIHDSRQGWEVAMKRSILVSFLAFLLTPVSNALTGYSSLFVFGDSLSDSGNNFLHSDQQITLVPISGNSFIPTNPYASKAYTNDQVWAQIVASSLGLSANPSLAGGTDYAYGGARTGTTSPEGAPSLEAQVGSFLSQYGPMIPGNALYVVEGGGDNARDGLEDIAQCHDTACIIRVILSTAVSLAETSTPLTPSSKPQAPKIFWSGTFRTSGRRPRCSRTAPWPRYWARPSRPR